MHGTILVATAGQGILRSNDDGSTWHRLGLKEAIEFDGVVRALAVHPHAPQRIYAGADAGLCVSENGGASWTRVDSPMNGQTIWSLAINPNDPRKMFAGTGAPSRCRLYRSADAGASWEAVAPVFPEFCAGVNRPRLLTIAIDPQDGNDVWFGVEEGGLWRSRDGGTVWERLDAPTKAIPISDIHAVSILRAADGAKTILVLTVNAVYRSGDDGASWSETEARKHFDNMYYARTVQPLADATGDLLLAIGDGTPGTRTMLYRSADRGASWQPTELATPPNSTFWSVGVHPDDPSLLFAGTKYGHLFRSRDGGRSWTRRGCNLPLGNYTSILINPNNTEEIFISSALETDGGIHYSNDAGQNWRRVDSKDMRLPSRRVWSMIFDPSNPSRIFAATHSSGIYRIDRDPATAVTENGSRPRVSKNGN